MGIVPSIQKPVATFLAAVLCVQTALGAWSLGGMSSMAFATEADEALVVSSSSAEYREFLSDRDPNGWTVGWGKLENDLGVTGRPISLLQNGRETPFSKGLGAHAPSKVVYTDVQDYGYERFEAWVGIDCTARDSASKVEFKVLADGNVAWRSGEMDSKTDAVFASVDLSSASVVTLVVEALDKAAAPYNHAVWADARFVKAQASPWLSASDKEFSIPDQVTSENILEGVFARTLSGEPGRTDGPVVGSDGTLRNGKEGNDLSDSVTYTTDYVAGRTGDFSVTYRVVDAQGLERTRTVRMSVQGTQRAELDASLDYLTKPFASYLYAGRDYFNEQGKKAFDLSVKTILEFGYHVDDYALTTRWGEEVYQVPVRFQDAGIYITKEDAAYLSSVIMDDEPRSFHMKDWAATVSMKDGMVDTATFYVAKRYGQKDASGQPYYHKRLLQAEENASRFLRNASEEMTDAQRMRAVLYPYADWVKYEGGGQTMDEALADGVSVCGGNARGSVYLSQRMGIKAYWVRTDSHAWSNVKLNHDDSGVSEGGYFRVDLLARPGCFLSVDAEHEGFHGHHNAVYFNRSKGYPDMTSESYPFAWTGWPSLTLAVEQSIVVLAPQDAGAFDPRSLIEDATSVYEGSLVDDVAIDDGGLSSRMVGGEYAPGFYTLTFSVSDARGVTRKAEGYVQVVDGEVDAADASLASSNAGSTFERVSLWSGTEEVPYAQGIRQNEAKAVTFDVAGKGYTHFDAWVGINGNVRENERWGMNGKVQLEVWARVAGGSDVLLASSPTMGWKTAQEHLLVSLPEGVESVTLKNVPKGSGNNHAAWGNPRFFSSEVLDTVPTPPSILGVEDGAVYSAPVAPTVEGASSVELYRKEIPTVVDPSTGQPKDTGVLSAVASASAPLEWGERVEGYEPGDRIANEGVYTLVASNRHGQTAIVGFTVDLAGVGGVEETTLADGSSLKVTYGEGGSVVSVELTVSQGAVQAGSVDLPIASIVGGASATAPVVSIVVPDGHKVVVTVPVVSPYETVLAAIAADGSERVLPKTWIEDGRLVHIASGSESLKVVHRPASFPDVYGDEWYALGNVDDFVYSRGILSGVIEPDGSVLFRGDAPLSRGMLVTMIHRVESEPSFAGEGFADVPADSWYAASSGWANAVGVAEGYRLPDGTVQFGGDDPVTREQVATFCYRYARLLGLDVSQRADMSLFEDASSVSWWAEDAMSWATATGLVKGDSGSGVLKARPGDGATRAEAAAIVMRFVALLYA